MTEETLEKKVAMYLAERLKASPLEQVSLRRPRKQVDILLRLNDEQIVVEMKIGEGWRKIVEGIVQANEYKERLKASGVIALVYPSDVRRPVENDEQVRHLALTTPVQALILSTFLNDHFDKINLTQLADRIAAAWANYQQQRIATISFKLIVDALRGCVQLLSTELHQNQGLADPVMETVVGSFELFRILAEGETQPSKQLEKQLRLAALDLAAYVLVNQLLLYRLLEMATGLPPLRPIERVGDLTQYFSAVTRIDYEAVYSVDVANRLPDIPSIRRHINNAITALAALRPEELPHDLIGRVFHEFLPTETQKLLGAFYTKPQAAELLAGLAIDKPDAVIFDPACGSGTLLVAAYRHKRRLLPPLSFKEQRHKHHEFVERQIYGADIMPFAAHLAAINVTLQDVHAKVNYLRIGVGHSLTLTPRAQVGTIASQLLLFEVAEGVDLNDPTPKRSNVFQLLTQVDIVLMNPPFTRKERLKANMLGNYKTAFSQAQNYWVYFGALADNFLTVGGKIAAVLPRDFLSGGPSQSVRDWLWSSGRYCLRYLVKTTKEVTFSEAARFRDFLVVLEKRNTETDQTLPLCAIVYLKRRLNELKLNEAADIARRIKELQQGQRWDDDDCSVVWLPQEKVRSGEPIFQFYVAFSSPDTAETLLAFLETLKEKAGQYLTTLTEVVRITRGLKPDQKGAIKAVYAVRPLHTDRLLHSPIVIEEETPNAVVVRFTNTNQSFKIPLTSLRPGLKTLAYLPTMDITRNSDWFICQRFKGFNTVELMLGVKVDFNALNQKANAVATRLAVGYRLDLAAPGTCLIAFYSDQEVVPQQAFASLHADSEMAKALCLWLNSVAFFVQIFANRGETRGSFCNLTNEMLRTTLLPTAKFFTEHNKDFADAFDRFRLIKW